MSATRRVLLVLTVFGAYGKKRKDMFLKIHSAEEHAWSSIGCLAMSGSEMSEIWSDPLRLHGVRGG